MISTVNATHPEVALTDCVAEVRLEERVPAVSQPRHSVAVPALAVKPAGVLVVVFVAVRWPANRAPQLVESVRINVNAG
jgi:hypothetical protein